MKSTQAEPSLYVSVRRAAELLAISEHSVRRLCVSGALPATKFGALWRIKREDIEGMGEHARESARAARGEKQ